MPPPRESEFSHDRSASICDPRVCVHKYGRRVYKVGDAETTRQLEEHTVKRDALLGLDIGADVITALLKRDGKLGSVVEFDNTPEGHRKIMKWVTKRGCQARVCVEATAVAPGYAFILGVADNIMPAARLDRLERIAEMVERWGNTPIEPDRNS